MSPEAQHRREARRLRRRAISLLEVEYRRGTPQRDQLEALSRDLGLDLETVAFVEAVTRKAADVLATLDLAHPIETGELDDHC